MSREREKWPNKCSIAGGFSRRKKNYPTSRFDMNLVLELDQKVTEQQVTLENAGVPGFRVTNNPTEVRVQMHLVDFIRRLTPA